MFYGISVLKDFAKFNWKTRALYSFFDKAAVCRPAVLFKATSSQAF